MDLKELYKIDKEREERDRKNGNINRRRDGSTTVTLVIGPTLKEHLIDAVGNIPHENMTRFTKRALQREIDLYHADPEDYSYRHGVPLEVQEPTSEQNSTE